MIVKKIIYNNGKNEGYFIQTRSGFIKVSISEGEAHKLKNIIKVTEVRFNEAILKVEEVNPNGSYIN